MGIGFEVADGGGLAGAVLFDGCSTIGWTEGMNGTGRLTEGTGRVLSLTLLTAGQHVRR